MGHAAQSGIGQGDWTNANLVEEIGRQLYSFLFDSRNDEKLKALQANHSGAPIAVASVFFRPGYAISPLSVGVANVRQ